VRRNTKEAIKAGMAAFQKFQKGDKMGALGEAFRAVQILAAPESGSGNKPEKRVEDKISAADIIMFSGCMDTQTSADAHIEGASTGAMSWALLKVLKENPNEITLTDLLRKLRGNLQGHYQQIPQMSTSHEMEVAKLPFTLI
jgi:hypothetical protein